MQAMKNEPVEIEYDFLNSKFAVEEEFIKLNDEKLPLSSISKLGLEFHLYKKFFQKKVLMIFLNEEKEVRTIYLVQKFKGKKFDEDADKISVFTTQLFEKTSNRPFYVKPYLTSLLYFNAIVIGASALFAVAVVAYAIVSVNSATVSAKEILANINWPVISMGLLAVTLGFGNLWGDRNRYRKPFLLNSDHYKREIHNFFFK